MPALALAWPTAKRQDATGTSPEAIRGKKEAGRPQGTESPAAHYPQAAQNVEKCALFTFQ